MIAHQDEFTKHTPLMPMSVGMASRRYSYRKRQRDSMRPRDTGMLKMSIPSRLYLAGPPSPSVPAFEEFQEAVIAKMCEAMGVPKELIED